MSTIPLMVQPFQVPQQDLTKTLLTIAQMRDMQEQAALRRLQGQQLQAQLDELPQLRQIGQDYNARVQGLSPQGPPVSYADMGRQAPQGMPPMPAAPAGPGMSYQDLQRQRVPGTMFESMDPNAYPTQTAGPQAAPAPTVRPAGPVSSLPRLEQLPPGVAQGRPPAMAAAPPAGPGPGAPPPPSAPPEVPQTPQTAPPQAPPRPPTFGDRINAKFAMVNEIATRAPLMYQKLGPTMVAGIQHEIDAQSKQFEQAKAQMETLKQGLAAVADAPEAARPGIYGQLVTMLGMEAPQMAQQLPQTWGPEAAQWVQTGQATVQTAQQRIKQAQDAFEQQIKAHEATSKRLEALAKTGELPIKQQQANIQAAQLGKQTVIDTMHGPVVVPEVNLGATGAGAAFQGPGSPGTTPTGGVTPLTMGGQPVLGKAQVEQENKMRDDYNAITKTYRQATDGFGEIQASASDPSAAGDLALLTGFMKLIDPESTVRQEEMRNAQAIGTIPQRLQGMYSKLWAGDGTIVPEVRQDILSRAASIYDQRTEDYNKTRNQLGSTIQAYGGDPTRVMADYTSTAPRTTGRPGAGMSQATAPASPGTPSGLPTASVSTVLAIEQQRAQAEGRQPRTAAQIRQDLVNSRRYKVVD